MKLVKRGKEGSGPLALVSKVFLPFWTMRRLQRETSRQVADPRGWRLPPKVPQLQAWTPASEVHRIDARPRTKTYAVTEWLGLWPSLKGEDYDSMRSMRKSIR